MWTSLPQKLGVSPVSKTCFTMALPEITDQLKTKYPKVSPASSLPVPLYPPPSLGEKCVDLRCGSSRLRLPHHPGLPGARLHRPRGGGLHLQQEPGGQEVRLRQDEGVLDMTVSFSSGENIEIFHSKWEPSSTPPSPSSWVLPETPELLSSKLFRKSYTTAAILLAWSRARRNRNRTGEITRRRGVNQNSDFLWLRNLHNIHNININIMLSWFCYIFYYLRLGSTKIICGGWKFILWLKSHQLANNFHFLSNCRVFRSESSVGWVRSRELVSIHRLGSRKISIKQ